MFLLASNENKLAICAKLLTTTVSHMCTYNDQSSKAVFDNNT